MDFCFVVNNKYITPLIVTLESIIENNSGVHRFFLITSELEQKNIKRVVEFSSSVGCKAEVIKVDDTCLENVPILRGDFNKTPYYKLLLPLYLPNDVEKILYMDVDVIVEKNLEELFSIDLENHFFAAVPDPFINERDKEYVKSLGIDLDKGERYFNSGVILFNMCIFREKYKLEDALKYIEENGSKFKFHDQEVLNGMYFKDYLQLEETYNYLTVFRGKNDLVQWLFKGRKQLEKQSILHYANSFKPWGSSYLGKYENIYWKYAQKSPVYCEIEKNEKKAVFQQLRAMLIIISRKVKKRMRG